MVETERVDFGKADRAKFMLLHEELVAVENGFGIGECDGWDWVVGLCKYLFVSFENYMEDDVVVFRAVVVIVAMPIGSVDVKLHIASPKTTVNFDFCVENIGASIDVGYARRDDSYALSEKSLLFFEI